MDCHEVLTDMKAEVLQKVAAAATNGDTPQIVSLGKRLDVLEKLLQRSTDLEAEVGKLLTTSAEEPAMLERSRREGETGREGGEQARVAIIDLLTEAGVHLSRVKGASYRLSTGALLGIAYATERNANRWFLGLTKGKFDHAILLCEESPSKVHALFLPSEFLSKHTLSVSGDGVKFNVTRSGNIFYLNIPNEGALQVQILDTTNKSIIQTLTGH